MLHFGDKLPDSHNRTPDPLYSFVSAGSGPKQQAFDKRRKIDHPQGQLAPCFLLQLLA